MKTVGIIGSGWSGAYAAKHMKEVGFFPTIFESTGHVGGQWHYDRNTPGGVLSTTRTVSSKHYMCPQDLPYPDSSPEFLSAEEVYQHFNRYIDTFDVRRHIMLFHTVLEVSKSQDNKWYVKTNRGNYIFDFLVIATGGNNKPNIPDDDMYKNFTGIMGHSHQFKIDIENRIDFTNRRILIIGGSDTASDYATYFSNTAHVSVSIRSGAWFQDRVVDEVAPEHPEAQGYPADMYYSRIVNYMLKKSHYRFTDWSHFPEKVQRAWGACGSGIPEWQSKSGYLQTYYVKSRELVRAVRAGKVTARGGVKKITGRTIEFNDTKPDEDFDFIIFCTGYKSDLPFKAPVKPDKNLFRKTLNYADPTVAFIGYIRPYLTSIPMLAEMQTRWLSTIWAENLVPLREIMQAAEVHDEEMRAKRFPLFYKKMPGLVDPYAFMEALSRDIEVDADYGRVQMHEPDFAHVAYLGTWSHFLFRLFDKDPHKRAIAKEELTKLKTHPISVAISNSGRPGLGASILNVFASERKVSLYYHVRAAVHPNTQKRAEAKRRIGPPPPHTSTLHSLSSSIARHLTPHRHGL